MIYKQKKLSYFQTVFIVSKVQPCILVSFVFKLSLGLVGGGQTGNISKFPKEDLYLDSLYSKIVILKQKQCLF